MSTESISRDAVEAAFSGLGESPIERTRTIPLMGGTATIIIVGGTESLLDELVHAADRCEARWSRFLPDSDITRLNWAEGAETAVDPLTIRLLQAMLDGAAATDGAYDPTLLPDVIAAGYAASVRAPDLVTTLPDSATARGDLSRVVIGAGRITLPLGMTLDAGGIGKGLTADILTELALADGAYGVMAEIGGDIAVAGRAPEGPAWRLGVEDPFDPERHLQIMRLTRGALVTSSQRKRRFGDQHHLVDPATGTSAVTRVQTVSVIAATGARAEALTKPGFLRDPHDYLAWLPTVGAAGLIIDDEGAMLASGNWNRYL